MLTRTYFLLSPNRYGAGLLVKLLNVPLWITAPLVFDRAISRRQYSLSNVRRRLIHLIFEAWT